MRPVVRSTPNSSRVFDCRDGAREELSFVNITKNFDPCSHTLLFSCHNAWLSAGRVHVRSCELQRVADGHGKKRRAAICRAFFWVRIRTGRRGDQWPRGDPPDRPALGRLRIGMSDLVVALHPQGARRGLATPVSPAERRLRRRCRAAWHPAGATSRDCSAFLRSS